ncbi:hypothetical protein KIK04_13560 [Paenibacillus sp. 481]|nr:hypothetical protein KIK04_13560 [Paenibacillus sp. 481]
MSEQHTEAFRYSSSTLIKEDAKHPLHRDNNLNSDRESVLTQVLGETDLPLSTLSTSTTHDEPAIAHAIRRLNAQGVPNVIVSLGKRGALAGMEGELYRVNVPQVEAVNTVGSGDAMVAGIIVGEKRGMSVVDRLRFGAACGTANVLMPSAGLVRREDIMKLLKEVTVECISQQY